MSSHDPLDTTPLSDYRIGREIGAGSFAKVYLGHTTKQPVRNVAIKSVLRSKLTKKLLENLESEISILKGIRHPHIVTLIDITNTGSHIHLIMEYCPLGDLSFFIKKRDKLGQDGQIPLLREIAINYPNTTGAGLHETLVRHFLRQLASALEFLRSKNLMHRDVKPQNLLLQPPSLAIESSGIGISHLPTLMLADFGFARYLQTSSMAETLCGSPLYMAPEILRYEKYDATADLWSVGTVLFEMLVGKPPFRASNHVELLRRIEKSNDEIKFPADVLLAEDLKRLIRALLKRDPKNRITFEQFFSDSVLTSELMSRDAGDIDPATAIENSMMARPIRSSTHPISVPNHGKASIPAEVVCSPAFITDLIPVNTPPSQALSIARSPPAAASNPIAQYSSDFQRRESMPTNRSRPQISPSSRSPVMMERRTSQRADSRPPIISRPSQEREQRIPSRLSNRTDSNSSLGTRERKERERDRDSEGEYVVIEKKTVEVNAFADAIARSPRPGYGTRKTSTHFTQQANQVSMSPVLQPNVAVVQTLAAAERRLGSSPTSALARALSIASQKLWGGGSPPSWFEQMVNNPLRQAATSRELARTDFSPWSSSHEALSTEEEHLIIAIQNIAIKSNVVYDFAELKLRQLIPPPPSQAGDESESLLTNEAIVSLCEEAMVLYLKTLQLLQKTIDLVQQWIARDVYNATSSKLNQAVQWTRDRYNEVLEKAEYVQQKKKTTLATVEASYPFEEVTAEKLLYDRALEMSRGAAVNEIVGEDLTQCEDDYQVGVLMLEAILETPAVGSSLGGEVSTIEEEDRKVIEKWVHLTRTRLDKLRHKLDLLREGSGQSR